ncbi:ArsA family ATPase [Cyanobacteria bacterium FACHB-DQ100]|uniref:Get3/ArsA fold putative tail anchor-mediating ATPase NosAFP n=1 Tax=Leptolyngbya sp. DQ-M1 TaxID=2933920 RepID=UPI0019C72FC3|nr:ArsA family ATPase [Cyanobacteria bacterium FACHB-DQ100]
MAFILTFLGKGGTGRTTIAIAAAKKLASQGKRVLLVGQDSSPAFGLALGTPIGSDPQEIAPNLSAVQLQTTTLLERSWDEVKKLEAQYLRTPFFTNVFGQELGVFPGLDELLALNALREFNQSNRYDTIVYDGTGDQNTLRMIGTAEVASWYIRRFRQVFVDSDLGRTLSPFIQPVASAILTNANFAGDNFAQPTGQVNDLLEQGKQAVNDPKRMAAYLVTTEDEGAIAAAKYLWGSAQQVGLTVGGVLLNRSTDASALDEAFQPLPVSTIPVQPVNDWQPLIDALPEFNRASEAPRPIAVNVAERKVSLFLPGFDKKQVKLTQYGTEITIEAGDQRRNIDLPPALRGQPVSGAKFQDGYLIISF